MKKLLKKLLPEEFLGMVDYYRSPEWAMSLGGAFNGQEIRKGIFMAICGEMGPEAIVETGTHVGTTTEFIAKAFAVPLFTVEENRRACGYAKWRLRRYRHVHPQCGDSRRFLAELVSSTELRAKRVFFYLDAHGGDDLPLAEELETIFGSLADAVVMIDDFQVPWDPGYAYDDYGEGRALTAVYLAPVVARHGLSQFFPDAAASAETGKRRGCVVLAPQGPRTMTMQRIPLLRPWP